MSPRSRDQVAACQQRLAEVLRGYPGLAVAFSGGVDSSVLLAMAKEVLKDQVIALTAESEVHPTGEREAAVAIAQQLKVRHILFRSDELADPQFVSNPKDRCYHCKKRLITAMRPQSAVLGFEILAHGANLDDCSDYRPGLKAAEELGVVSPLVQAGLTKADIRALAKQLGLPNWDRPAMACLATRIPYGVSIERKVLQQIDQAETFLRRMGIDHCRVRHHGELARIEVEARQIERLSKARLRRRIVDELRSLGYAHVCIDLEGYATGKMNRGVVTQAK
ncbi:MAG: ATP-dependent sacrificial sulfur transferase LarE [Desulfobacteraceae bacterium]|nr:ATP-dependent sacrificial sulfur transferase LarE [Desulfobacteraceae bacterium]